MTDIRDFTTTPLPIPKIFLVVYLLNLRSECLVSYDPHFPGNDGTNKTHIARVPVTTTPAPLFEYLTPRGKAL